MIVSTTLVGPGTLDALDAALESVSRQVDLSLVIVTTDEVTRQDVKHAAQRAGLSKAYAVAQFPWVGDFSAARNFALNVAAELGGTWAVTLDTDERLHFDDGVALRALLANSDADCLLALQVDGSYAKERVLRLSKPWRWTGRTHEALPWIDGTKRVQLAGVRFSELAKTPEQLAAKFERDKLILLEDVGGHAGPTPANARSWYYLGESYYGLGQLEQAVFAFDCCGRTSAWREEAAFAHYRAADIECKRGRFEQAIEHAAAGMVRHAGISELPWVAGFASYKLGRFEQAVHWSLAAIQSGAFHGTAGTFSRDGFRYQPALYEGPFDVLAFSWQALGNETQAGRAHSLKRAAEALRLKP